MAVKLFTAGKLSLFYNKLSMPIGNPEKGLPLEDEVWVENEEGKVANSGMWIHGRMLQAVYEFGQIVQSSPNPLDLQVAMHKLLNAFVQNRGYSSLKIAGLLKSALCYNEASARQCLATLQQARAEWVNRGGIGPKSAASAPAADVSAAHHSNDSSDGEALQRETSVYRHKMHSMHHMNSATKNSVLEFIDQMISYIQIFLGKSSNHTNIPRTSSIDGTIENNQVTDSSIQRRLSI